MFSKLFRTKFVCKKYCILKYELDANYILSRASRTPSSIVTHKYKTNKQSDFTMHAAFDSSDWFRHSVTHSTIWKCI